MLIYFGKGIKYFDVICVKYKTAVLFLAGVVYENISIMKLESRPG
jgi:hypothetical protein